MFASLICLKRSVASSTFVGLRSGWYIKANLRKAFLIDASSAVSGRPRAFKCFVLADCAMAAAPGLASLGGSPQAWGSPSSRRAPPSRQGCQRVRLIDRWRGRGPAMGCEGRSTPAAAGAQRQFVRGRDASPARLRGLVDVSGRHGGGLRCVNPTQSRLAALARDEHWGKGRRSLRGVTHILRCLACAQGSSKGIALQFSRARRRAGLFPGSTKQLA